MNNTPPPLHKHTIVIWSEHDEVSLANLGQEAEDGMAYCSKFEVEKVEDPGSDPDWDGTEFFEGV